MTCERESETTTVEPNERLSFDGPTTLDLFDFTPEQAEELTVLIREGQQLRPQLARVDQTITELYQASRAIKERQDRVQDEMIRRSFEYQSSITTGLTYLLFQEELKGLTISDEDFLDFYMRCLRINTQYCASIFVDGQLQFNVVKAYKDDALFRQNENFKFANLVWANAGSVPKWFTGDADAWQRFVSEHASFYTRLIDSSSTEFIDSFGIPNNLRRYLGSTLGTGLPDWLQAEPLVPPDPTVVGVEMLDDIIEYQQLETDGAQSEDQKQAAIARLIPRVDEAVDFGLARKQAVFHTNASFAQAVIQAWIVDGIKQYVTLTEVTDAMGNIQTAIQSIPPEKAGITQIAVMHGTENWDIAKWMAAFWLESQLRAVDPTFHAQEQASEQMQQGILGSLALARGDTALSSHLMQKVRQTNRKLYRMLTYELQPILRALPHASVEGLFSYMEGCDGELGQQLIMEIATPISEYLNTTDPKTISSKEEQRFRSLQKTGETWINTNWQWYANSLISRYKKPLKKLPSQTEQPAQATAEIEQEDKIDPIAEIASVVSPQPDEQESTPLDRIEEDIAKELGGNLYGWRVYYTLDTSLDPASFSEITGSALTEREESLQQVLGRERIPRTVQAKSLINALNKELEKPTAVRRRTQRLDVDGVYYTRLKRANTRIFYVSSLDRKDIGENTIVFFVDKKAGQQTRLYTS